MTAKKNLKRLVRARARKTGESYAAALRNFLKKPPGGQPVPAYPSSSANPPLRRVEKPEYGFAIYLPADWVEQPPDPFNSPWEVGRFSTYDPVFRNCLVFRNPESPDASLDAIARTAEANLARTGFGNFRHLPAQIAGLSAARIDFDRPAPDGGTWSVRHHFFLAAGHRFCLSFGTTARAEDTVLIDRLASRFELIGDPPGAAASTTGAAGEVSAPAPRIGIGPELRRRVERYSPRARAVLIAAHEEAIRRRSPVVDQSHLLFGVAAVEGSMGLLILEDLGLSQSSLRQAIDAALPPLPIAGERTTAGTADEVISLPLTDIFQDTLTLAEDEARALGHSYIGVEHLLLGLLRHSSGPAHQLLTRHGITTTAARAALRKRLPSSSK